jgi:ATP-dependent RNA helicase DDX35
MNIAQRQANSSYLSIRNNLTLYLHPSSVLNALHPEWIMFHEIVKTNRYYVRDVSELDHRWLIEIAPHFYEDNRNKNIEMKHRKEVESNT